MHTLATTESPHLQTTSVDVKNIVAATDLSRSSAVAMRTAVRLARRFGATLHIIYAAELPVYELDLSSMGQTLEQAQVEGLRAELHGFVSRFPALRAVKTTETIVRGPAPEAVRDLVHREAADLVVIGSHGRTGIMKALMGSVAEKIVRAVSCPVVICGPHCSARTKPTGSILFATSLAPGDLRAAQYAVSVMNRTDAQLNVLYVSAEASTSSAEGAARSHFEKLEELRHLVSHTPEKAHRFGFQVEIGPVAEKIEDAADECDAGLIVIGLDSQGPLADHIPFNTHTHVIRNARCPVMIVPRLAAQ
jgi:nucleotide-binding universal stress UspA family protein